MSLGPRRGVWAARIATEGVAFVFAWVSGLAYAQMIASELPPSRRRCGFVVASVASAFAVRRSHILMSLSECYNLQLDGLFFVFFALLHPHPQTSAAEPTSESIEPLSTLKKKKKFKHSPSPSTTPPTSSHAWPTALSARLTILVLTFILAYSTSLTSNHCPMSILRPAFLLSTNTNTSTSRLLATKPSVTGVVVVGEEVINGDWARYLRVDHSFLGGLWIGIARDAVLEGWMGRGEEAMEKEAVRVAESVYTTFILQEIVRLAGDATRSALGHERGLIIGLGAGLSARALHLHGINTTVVEIDPVVYEFAREYFGVEEPRGGVVLEDARKFMRSHRGEKFDYIVHDVFTGGTVPSSLFTTESWSEVKSVLAPHGVVAINFAGNILSTASHLVLVTLLSSFPFCRGFTDGPPKGDFRNIVMLCSCRPIVMRDTESGDFLEYPSPLFRRHMLENYKEFEMDLRDLSGLVDEGIEVVSDARVKVLDEAQLEGAFEHWEIMRGPAT
ncbi:spermine synthase [Pseudohyphozyma bogoriensis]|nr:spermine synthase [Pseudohyphozyma bogoriensis]